MTATGHASTLQSLRVSADACTGVTEPLPTLPLMVGGAVGGSPLLIFYLCMLLNDALVDISNFYNLFYISYI